MTAFGPLLRLLRQRSRLSQEQLAEHAGLSSRTVRNLEHGHAPRLDSVRLLAAALGLTGPALAGFERAAGVTPAGPVGVFQLPRDLPDFGERDDEVAAVEAALAGGAATAVVEVCGLAGVGKTALAVHAAHRVAGRYPDGQLHARLRGGQADRMEPGEVLDRFLRAMGVDGASVPPAVEERAALFRSLVAGRRMLVVLDDASGEEQVRPLLPGGPGNAVLLTGRRALTGLEGMRTIPLDVLGLGSAVRLLARIAGPGRVDAEPVAADRVAAACGGLPLALRVVGARLAAGPGIRLGDLADLLAGERTRLDQLETGDLAVRATFALGYRELDGPAQRAFRLLGLLSSPDAPAWTVAALLDLDPAAAGRLAERLTRTGLVEAPRAGRLALHDLVRLYARERTEAEDAPEQRRAAVRRALTGWLVLADEADRRLSSDAIPLRDRLVPGWRPEPGLVGDPLDWFERERPALVAGVRLAAEVAPELVAGLADSLIDFCATRGYPDDWATVAGTLLAVAEAAGDRRLAGHAERRLAELGLYRNDGTAGKHADRSLELAEAAGDLRGGAAALLAAGAATRFSGRPADGRPLLERSVRDFEAAGDPHGAGHAIVELAMLESVLGEFAAAADHLEEGAARMRAAGDVRGEARAQLAQGDVAARIGDPPAAVRHYRWAEALTAGTDPGLATLAAALTGRALVQSGDVAAAIGTLTGVLAAARDQHRPAFLGIVLLGLGEAYVLAGDPAAARAHLLEARATFAAGEMVGWHGLAEAALGDAALAEGDLPATRGHWRTALALFERGGPSHLERLRRKLDALTG